MQLEDDLTQFTEQRCGQRGLETSGYSPLSPIPLDITPAELSNSVNLRRHFVLLLFAELYFTRFREAESYRALTSS